MKPDNRTPHAVELAARARKSSVSRIMLDVIIALLPTTAAAAK